MADKKDKTPTSKSSKRIRDLAAGIQQNMDTIYRRTYSSDPSVSRDLDNLTSKINYNINKISDDNKASLGTANISKLYNRIIDSSKVRDGSLRSNSFVDQVASMFEDGPLMDDLYASMMSNYYLTEMDNEIDAICRYMPKLEEALETKKDNVLSADHFSKDFLTFTTDDDGESKQFKMETDEIKREYDLLNFTEELYDKAARYGEQFVYIVPYDKAVSKLINNKPNTLAPEIGNFAMREGACIITESGNGKVSTSNLPFSLDKGANVNVEVEINRSGIIESVVGNAKRANDTLKRINESSFWNENSSIREDVIKDDILARTNITGNLSFEGMEDSKNAKKIKNNMNDMSLDGTVEVKPSSIKVKGCILKILDHDKVYPIYIDDICMGYYYIEIIGDDAITRYTNMMGDPMTQSVVNLKNGSIFNNMEASKKDDIIRYMSGQLSQYIDKNFINNNQDLRKEIYMILKHNDTFNSVGTTKMKVTFIHPDEMEHVYFRQDPKTHRGISDLDKALVPAKMYCALYLTNSIAYLTRGQDKRVYYVKQNVETNIAKSLMNVIQQIKQGNFGIRQFRSINSVLNITGRFNDYVIPTNASGDPPIQMEVMQGQSVDLKNEMLEMLEEMAINSTDVPLELIQARLSMDYATHYTMSSSKFLRKAYKRQGQYQGNLSSICTKIYNCEHPDTPRDVNVTLPPPVFLNLTNTNQIMDNIGQYVDKVVEIDLGGSNDDKLRSEYKKLLTDYHLGTYIDIEKNRMILKEAELNVKLAKDAEEDNNGGY